MRSFSQRVKDELLTLLSETEQTHTEHLADSPHTEEGFDATADSPARLTAEERDATFLFILISQATFLGGKLRYQSTSERLVKLAARWLDDHFGDQLVQVRTKGQRTSLLMDDPEGFERLVNYLRENVRFDTTLGRISLQPQDMTQAQGRALLRSLFLAQGSIANPTRSYQLELVFRRRTLASLSERVLFIADLDAQRVERDMRVYLYLKNGDNIARYLALIGAHQALLTFENFRVERELRGQVNRQVNFDSANIQKVADAAARQLAEIAQIRESGLFDELPQDLIEIAQAREANPSYSLAELGETLDPPMGKSGVRHRLKRLSQFAKEHSESE